MLQIEFTIILKNIFSQNKKINVEILSEIQKKINSWKNNLIWIFIFILKLGINFKDNS